jgi:hypothetical protein
MSIKKVLNKKRIIKNKNSQMGSTITIFFAILAVLFIFILFFLIASLMGGPAKESVVLKERADEYLKQDEQAKTSFGTSNTIISISSQESLMKKAEIFSINLAQKTEEYSLAINSIISEINTKITKNEKIY